ncbi:MAG TPA: hypothetical protein DIC23_07980, partial [Planctomycetaceae bacterium]|nr:hypothetical protein [Planctomycetaceae bacterium]
ADKKADKKADKPEAEETPPLDLDDTDPPPPPATPTREIERKYLSLESQREKIRRGLLNWRTESLIRKSLKVLDDESGEFNLSKVIDSVRRADATGNSESQNDDTVQKARTHQLKVKTLSDDLENIAEAAKISFRTTGLVTLADIHRRSESTTAGPDVDSAEFYSGLTLRQQIKSGFNPATFQRFPEQSVVGEIFSRETATIYTRNALIPSESREYNLEDEPSNVVRLADQSAMKPDGKYFLWVVLEEVPAHIPRLEPMEWDGSETIDEINQEHDYDVLVAPPGTVNSLTVKEWFAILSQDNKPVRNRHLEVTRTEKNGEEVYTAIEFVGEQTLKSVVEDAIRMKNAARRAKDHAEKEIKPLIEKSKPETPLAETLAGLTNSGEKADPKQVKSGDELELKFQFIQTAVTADFSWQAASLPTAAPTGILSPTRQGISEITDLPVPASGQGAGQEFMKEFCETLATGEVGIAFNHDHTAVYVGRVVSRTEIAPSEFNAQVDQLFRSEPFRLQRLNETRSLLAAWLAAFQERHKWNGTVLSVGTR